jgi:hypothetical protein
VSGKRWLGTVHTGNTMSIKQGRCERSAKERWCNEREAAEVRREEWTDSSWGLPDLANRG